MNQTEMYQKAILSGDQNQLRDLIKSYGKPRKPFSPLVFVSKDNKEEKEAKKDGRSQNDDNGRVDD